ncbi:Holliday junction ATP-dependent DNA helicase RuvA [Rickettsiales bacterium Ac37b]|nr:Holliday junction ATP-dependent DNA helicase RuvA [Rickettsiales bacterium Ac37b]
MIGKLTGKVDHIDKDTVLIDVMGVGYIVFCSNMTIKKLSVQQENVSLIIETYVREDQISLYGFYDTHEKYWFGELTKIKGVGPKLALTILGTLTPDALVKAIALQDKTSFAPITGVGPKLIERLLTELKSHKNISNIVISSDAETHVTNTRYDAQTDAISALVNLGYAKHEAYQVTNRLIANNDNVTTEQLIKLALKELSK